MDMKLELVAVPVSDRRGARTPRIARRARVRHEGTVPNIAERDTLRSSGSIGPPQRLKGSSNTMVKPMYLFFAFLAMLATIAVLIAFVTHVDNGSPFDRGDSPTIKNPPTLDVVE